jgi:hypothetical protein
LLARGALPCTAFTGCEPKLEPIAGRLTGPGWTTTTLARHEAIVILYVHIIHCDFGTDSRVIP